MKKWKNEIECAEFSGCVCVNIRDLICVSCDKWFCDDCLSSCVQCEQLVCEECYKQDLCCLVRPWGEKTECHLRDFYQNKLVDGKGMYLFNDNVKYGNEYRMEAVKRTIDCYVDSFDASSLSACKPEFVRDYFPNITKDIAEEEISLKFLGFIEETFRSNRYVFACIFLNNEVREDLLTVMDESIRSNEEMQSDLIYLALKSKELFGSLKNRKLLDWNLVRSKHYAIKHIDALKWVEENGVDVVNNEGYFIKFVRHSPSEIMEYLIVEKGITLEYMSENIWRLRQDLLKMVYRLKGIEGILKIDSGKIWFDFEEAKFLRSIGYKFNKSLTSNRDSRWLYALICFKVLKYEDLNEEVKGKFDEYIKERDIKACKHLYPFMKEIRKRKIMTVILCIRKTCILQKEIIWNILDLAYSPINERGSI